MQALNTCLEPELLKMGIPVDRDPIEDNTMGVDEKFPYLVYPFSPPAFFGWSSRLGN